MKRTSALPKLKLYFKRASPTILSVLAAVGTAATAITAVRATPKAMRLLKEASDEKGEKLTRMETVRLSGGVYIPAAAIGLSTIFCIFGANLLNQRRQTALAGALTLVQQSYRQYRSKLKELYGKDAHDAVADALAKERSSDIRITCPGMVGNSTLDFDEGAEPEIVRTFYDSFSNRYFESTISKVLQAEYHLNRNFMFGGVVSLNDFYAFLGLEQTPLGETVGWSSCNGDIYWIDFDHHRTVLDDGLECFVIDMVFEPTAEWLSDW